MADRDRIMLMILPVRGTSLPSSFDGSMARRYTEPPCRAPFFALGRTLRRGKRREIQRPKEERDAKKLKEERDAKRLKEAGERANERGPRPESAQVPAVRARSESADL